MPENIRTKTLRVADMTCVSCERKIEKKLKGTAGVADAKANFSDGSVQVTYNASTIDIGAIEKLIEGLDYHMAKEERRHRTSDTVLKVIWISIALYELYAILDRFELLNIFYNFPEAKAGMGYGMLFMVGLLTSVHCVAMCGGINLSQSLSNSALPSMPHAMKFLVIRSGFLYNLGRVISYTLIGGLVGALGAVVSPSEGFRGAIQLIAGVFMVVMGLNMLNVFPWLRRFTPRMPKIFADKISAQKNNGPLFVGLLNGFMPCGPLQAMQLYALSTGSLVQGAMSMFVFSAGTLPLMFGLSALSSILSKKFTRGMMTVGATMVVVMGVAMFGNGMNLTGFSFDSDSASLDVATGVVSQSESGQAEGGVVQLVRTELKSGRYDPIKVQVGVPVRWNIYAKPGTVNGCNNRIIIPEYDRLQKKLAIGDNIVEFTPNRTGTFTYTCWMGMIRGKITVVEKDAGNQTVAAATLPVASARADDAKNPEDDYDSDPFAELFATSPEKKADPGNEAVQKSESGFYTGVSCPCCAQPR
ncbi:heavy metal-associated domain-containing protein [Synergistales bacterium]|nr:heavy metal-associated domain-containing protein [Synergistales bacterium]